MGWPRELEGEFHCALSLSPLYESSLCVLRHVLSHEENIVRKAYFKLAQKYHPDKNPDGRVSCQVASEQFCVMCMPSMILCQDMFEAVNKAYEFLCSKSAKTMEGPDPKRIVLLLGTQSIIFTRCAEGKC